MPSPFPKSMETSLELMLATARSRNVSPLKSPTATDNGAAPAAKLVAAPNVPSPFPKSIETSSEIMLATAKSRESIGGGGGVGGVGGRPRQASSIPKDARISMLISSTIAGKLTYFYYIS